MKILLFKVRKSTLFSIFEPIVVEPLELEYLKAVLSNHEVTIFDPLLERKKETKVVKKGVYDVVVLNGYITAEDQILKYAEQIKAFNNQIKVIVSGVHVQLNPEVFRTKNIDMIFKSQSLSAFKEALEKPNFSGKKISGLDYRFNEEWVIGDDLTLNHFETIAPQREYFEKHKDQFRYMDYKGVAMIRGSISCPYQCSFCYCRKLNQGHYVYRRFNAVFQEMKAINTNIFWIVDDTLLTNRNQAQEFIKESQASEFKGRIIAYLRSDFIVQNKDLLSALKEAGLYEVIVGFESIKTGELSEYQKGTTSTENLETIQLLIESGIKLAALFIVGLEYTKADFKALRGFIKAHHLDLFTVSIWTPLKGTLEYQKNKAALDQIPTKYFDFLHLVLPPKNMGRLQFYFEVMRCYLVLLLKKPILRLVTRRIKEIL